MVQNQKGILPCFICRGRTLDLTENSMFKIPLDYQVEFLELSHWNLKTLKLLRRRLKISTNFWLGWFQNFWRWILGFLRIHPIYDFREFSTENGHSDLRQVIGINYLIKLSTYRLACGDSEITWVGWLIQPNT